MKINLELEIGPETGTVVAALEEQIKMLETAEKLNVGSATLLLDITKRLNETLNQQINSALEPYRVKI
jgi:hypothetical protein